jgi:hypothetical protein
MCIYFSFNCRRPQVSKLATLSCFSNICWCPKTGPTFLIIFLKTICVDVLRTFNQMDSVPIFEFCFSFKGFVGWLLEISQWKKIMKYVYFILRLLIDNKWTFLISFIFGFKYFMGIWSFSHFIWGLKVQKLYNSQYNKKKKTLVLESFSDRQVLFMYLQIICIEISVDNFWFEPFVQCKY